MVEGSSSLFLTDVNDGKQWSLSAISDGRQVQLNPSTVDHPPCDDHQWMLKLHSQNNISPSSIHSDSDLGQSCFLAKCESFIFSFAWFHSPPKCVRVWHQVDQMSLQKIAQNVAQPILYQN
jgi:hypothetical protein